MNTRGLFLANSVNSANSLELLSWVQKWLHLKVHFISLLFGIFENIVWLTNNTSFHIKSSTYCNISLTVGVSHKNGIFKNIVWLTNNTCDASTRLRPLAPLLIGMSRTWTKMNHSESLRLLSSFYDHIFIIKNLDILPVLELLQIPLEVALRGGSAGQYKTFNTKFWKTQISRNILFSTCCETPLDNIKLSKTKFWKTQISRNILFQPVVKQAI